METMLLIFTNSVGCWMIFGCGGFYLLLTVILRLLAGSSRDLRLDGRVISKGGTTLIVMVHGYKYFQGFLKDVQATLEMQFPDADLLIADYASGTFSNALPEILASDLEKAIDKAYKLKHYERILLVGHSIGALLVRKAYLYGCGRVEDRVFDNTAVGLHDWVNRVDRMVLLAGMNRGWTMTPRPAKRSIIMHTIYWITHQIGRWTNTALLIRKVEKGGPFISNMRLQWLDTIRDGLHGNMTVVQLLGDWDDVVSDEDSKDAAVAKNFIFMRLERTGHNEIAKFPDTEIGKARKESFVQALQEQIEVLRTTHREVVLRPDPRVKRVIFVVHGIRDTGGWTLRLRRYIIDAYEKLGHAKESLLVLTPQYDRFPMAAFLLVADRQANVRWFMDEVTEAKSKYPELDEINFIGHSNGTFILSSALERYAALKMHRVIFAGSVAPRRYPWKKYLAEPCNRVTGIYNFTAAGDYVVGIFPRLFELINERFGTSAWGCNELGSAGFSGFQDSQANCDEVRYLIGNHSAAVSAPGVEENIYPAMVNYIVTGEAKTDFTGLDTQKQDCWVVACSNLCWFVWALLFMLVIGTGVHFYQSFHSIAGQILWVIGYALFVLVLLYTI